jgi:hypothetical protein
MRSVAIFWDKMKRYFHFGEYEIEEVKLAIALFDVLMKFFIRDFVALFVLAIIGQLFLDGIVGQMDTPRTKL